MDFIEGGHAFPKKVNFISLVFSIFNFDVNFAIVLLLTIECYVFF